MVGAPYAAVVRLVGTAAETWEFLDAAHPTLDLVRLPFTKFLNIVYARTYPAWATGEWKRRTQGLDPGSASAVPQPTLDEFNFILETPLYGGPRRDDDQDFFSDYV